MTGAQLIRHERHEQILRHKRTIAYDVKTNTGNELALAAIRLTMSVAGITEGRPDWPDHWDKTICAKMDAKTDFEKITVAGAFLAADLDRRQALGCGPGKAFDEFTQAARPLMEYLLANHNSHHIAIVSATNSELWEGVRSTGEIKEYTQD